METEHGRPVAFDAMCDVEFMRRLNREIHERTRPEYRHEAWNAMYALAVVASGDEKVAGEWVRDLRGTK